MFSQLELLGTLPDQAGYSGLRRHDVDMHEVAALQHNLDRPIGHFVIVLTNPAIVHRLLVSNLHRSLAQRL